MQDYLSSKTEVRQESQEQTEDEQDMQDVVNSVAKVVMDQDKERLEERSSLSGKTGEDSKFFADPHNPDPSEWSDWLPEKWIEWSESEEYKELYSNPLNSYRPPQVSQPDKVPVLDYREKFPVIVTQLSTARPETEQKLEDIPSLSPVDLG